MAALRGGGGPAAALDYLLILCESSPSDRLFAATRPLRRLWPLRPLRPPVSCQALGPHGPRAPRGPLRGRLLLRARPLDGALSFPRGVLLGLTLPRRLVAAVLPLLRELPEALQGLRQRLRQLWESEPAHPGPGGESSAPPRGSRGGRDAGAASAVAVA